MTFLIRQILALCLLIGVCLNVYGQQTFFIGIDDINYYPIFDHDQNGVEGVAKVILDKFAESKGYDFQYRATNAKKLVHQIAFSGEIDFKFPDDPRWHKRLKSHRTFHYSKGFIDYTNAVMTEPDKADDTLYRLGKIGIVKGVVPYPLITDIRNRRLLITEAEKTTDLIGYVLHGQINGLYANVDVVKHNLRMMKKISSLQINEQCPQKSGKFSISSIKHGDVISELNDFIDANQSWIQTTITAFLNQ